MDVRREVRRAGQAAVDRAHMVSNSPKSTDPLPSLSHLRITVSKYSSSQSATQVGVSVVACADKLIRASYRSPFRSSSPSSHPSRAHQSCPHRSGRTASGRQAADLGQHQATLSTGVHLADLCKRWALLCTLQLDDQFNQRCLRALRVHGRVDVAELGAVRLRAFFKSPQPLLTQLGAQLDCGLRLLLLDLR